MAEDLEFEGSNVSIERWSKMTELHLQATSRGCLVRIQTDASQKYEFELGLSIHETIEGMASGKFSFSDYAFQADDPLAAECLSLSTEVRANLQVKTQPTEDADADDQTPPFTD